MEHGKNLKSLNGLNEKVGDNLKEIKLLLKDNKALVINDPIYVEKGETVRFVIINSTGELFYSTGDKNIKIYESSFSLGYDEVKALKKLNIIQKGDNIYPDIFEVEGLKLHDVMVIGRSVDEKYPDVIQDIYKQLNMLSKAVIDLYDKLDEKEKEGVIE